MSWKKPSTCNCGPGGFRAHGSSWVVLERRSAKQSSRLKCLACGWKWWSFAGYVFDLRDHKEESRSGMTDEDILDRINDGTLTVLVNEARVFSFTKGSWHELSPVERTPPSGTSYRFVEVCRHGRKKKVALHRLVWMFAHRSLVPEGYDVDHIEGKVRDTIDNLRLLESSANRSRGKPRKLQEETLPGVPF